MNSHKVFLATIIAMIFVGASSSILAYSETIYRMDRATGLLSRAETGGFVEDLVAYVERARELLPNSGNPVWIFSTDRTDFGEIQKDIRSILDRARIISTVPKDSSAYQQGMDDIRDKIKTLEEQLAAAAPYMLLSPANLLLSAFWVFALIGLVTWYSRARRRHIDKSLGPPGAS